MGQKASHQAREQLAIRSDEWQLVRTEGSRDILSHRFLDKPAEMHHVLCDSKHSTEQEMAVYLFRKNESRPLVEVYAAEESKGPGGYCGQRSMRVITERIPHRYRHLPSLPLPDTLYVLCEALRGFGLCYENAGKFAVSSGLVGLNCRGQVKVWLNEQYARNHPEAEQPTLQVTSGARSSLANEEQQMVRRVVAVVEEKCQEGQFPLGLKALLWDCASFQEAYASVEQYTQERKIWVPDRVPVNKHTRVVRSPAGQSKVREEANHFVDSKARPSYRPHATYMPFEANGGSLAEGEAAHLEGARSVGKGNGHSQRLMTSAVEGRVARQSALRGAEQRRQHRTGHASKLTVLSAPHH